MRLQSYREISHERAVKAQPADRPVPPASRDANSPRHGKATASPVEISRRSVDAVASLALADDPPDN